MQLATTGGTLEFLQGAYATFRAYTDAQKAQALEFNELVRAGLEKPELPLRLLYIDLLMHDEMIRRSQASHDTQRARIETLMRNKVGLQRMIRQRESVDEAVTPDARTEAPDLALADLLAVFPPERQAQFHTALHPVWTQWQHRELTPQDLVAVFSQQCVVLGCRSLADFRALFTVIEYFVSHEQTNTAQ